MNIKNSIERSENKVKNIPQKAKQKDIRDEDGQCWKKDENIRGLTEEVLHPANSSRCRKSKQRRS